MSAILARKRAQARHGATPAEPGLALPLACAAVAPLVAALSDAATRAPEELRDVVLGVALGGDRSGSAPLAQILVPLLELLPIGDREHRALVALSLPAALATFLLVRRALRAVHAEARRGALAIAGALGALAAVLLVSAPPGAALIVVAVELAALVPAPLAWTTAASLFAAWCAPRLSPALLLPVALALRRARPGGRFPAALHALPPIAAGVALLVVRDGASWLVLGRALRTGPFAPLETALVATPLAFRAAWAIGLAVAAAIALARLGRDLSVPDRTALAAAAVLALVAEPLRAAGAVEGAMALALPSVGELFMALFVAIARAVPSGRPALRLGLSWLVPALSAGFAARGLEDELVERRRPLEHAAAVGLAPLASLGLAGPRPVVVVEDEPTLIRDAWSLALDDLRPDLAILPTQALLLGGPGRMATLAVQRLPRGAELLRSTLATGLVTESGSSPLAADASLVVDLPVARLREIARHLDPSLGAMRAPLERVDPSDRRLRRQGGAARQRFLDRGRAARFADPWTVVARLGALRAARLLALAGDRDGALAEVARARVLGDDPARVGRWETKLGAKRGLADEPDVPGE